MNKYTYKRYYLICGSKYFCGTYTYRGEIYAIWGSKTDAKQYRILNKVKAMKEKLEKRLIQGDHEKKDINIETVEKDFY